MIAVDTSALMAILLGEPDAGAGPFHRSPFRYGSIPRNGMAARQWHEPSDRAII